MPEEGIIIIVSGYLLSIVSLTSDYYYVIMEAICDNNYMGVSFNRLVHLIKGGLNLDTDPLFSLILIRSNKSHVKVYKAFYCFR